MLYDVNPKYHSNAWIKENYGSLLCWLVQEHLKSPKERKQNTCAK